MLHAAKISCEPLLLSLFELQQPNPQQYNLTYNLMQQVYLAHYGYYNATNQYRAFSEGGSPSGSYIYEWVVLPDNRTWTVLTSDGSTYTGTDAPVIYTKVAIKFLSPIQFNIRKEHVRLP